MTAPQLHHSGPVVGLVETVEEGIKRALHRLEYDYGYDPRRISCATSLAELTGVDPDHTIVHICTPADDHASALRAATEVGFRRVIVEKPCAADTADVDEMRRIADRTGASIAVINPSLCSRSVGPKIPLVRATSAPRVVPRAHRDAA